MIAWFSKFARTLNPLPYITNRVPCHRHVWLGHMSVRPDWNLCVETTELCTDLCVRQTLEPYSYTQHSAFLDAHPLVSDTSMSVLVGPVCTYTVCISYTQHRALCRTQRLTMSLAQALAPSKALEFVILNMNEINLIYHAHSKFICPTRNCRRIWQLTQATT